MTAVTCPIMRYHPAIIAQGAATMAVLSENRFILGLGAGERLNEHVIGEGWPGIGERHERLSEAYDIIRGLLEGSMKNYRGKYFKLDDTKLYDRPDCALAIIGAAGGPDEPDDSAHPAEASHSWNQQSGIRAGARPRHRSLRTSRSTPLA